VSSKFLDRERERAELERIASRPGSQFVVVYGRRRIGKTALLVHFVEAHPRGPHFYFTAHRSSSELLLNGFSQRFREQLAPERAPFTFDGWEAAFTELFVAARKRRVVAVVDEYPYLAEAVPEIPTLLQRLWDEQAKSSKLLLMLSGSHYHMMQREFLAPSGPLYGRSTAAFLLEELELAQMQLFLPAYGYEDLVATYAVIGGVPKYLELWNDQRPVLRNVRDLVLSPATLFRHEALLLIQDEIAEPRTYLAILEALRAGLKTPTALAADTGVRINHMGKYLSTLLELRIIRRVVSEDAPDPRNSRTTRYEIRDPFLRFHFEFLHRHQELLEQNRTARLAEIIERRFDAFVGKTAYEELARRRIAVLGDAGEIPFVPESVGRAFTRDVEIDVVARGRGDSLLVGECKWQGTKMAPGSLDDLKRRTQRFVRFSGRSVRYALFSRSGFSRPLLERASAEGVLLFTGAELKRVRLRRGGLGYRGERNA
jgi:AAA+ ATPase superfamily predicted ATPase